MAQTITKLDSLIKYLETSHYEITQVHDPTAKDILQINNCINSFLQCLDNGNGKEMSQLFAKNGTIEIVKINKLIKGQESIVSFCESLHEKFKGCTHWESNVVIKFNKDLKSATNESYWKGIKQDKTVSYGLHKDTFIKNENGNWVFQHRIIQHLWNNPN